MREYCSRSGRAGSGRRAACQHRRLHHHRSRCRRGICRLPSARSLRSCVRGALGCGRLAAGWGGRDRPSRASCGATRPRAVAAWSIGPSRRNGTLNDPGGVRSWQNWRSTRRCGSMCRTVGWGDCWPKWGGDPRARISGPAISWKGRRHGLRKSRRSAAAWSPEQIARRLRLDCPDDGTMRVSHEAIYQALYVQSRGALRCELTTCLRTGRALRIPRARSRDWGKSDVGPEVLISERPAEAGDRAVPGHWESAADNRHRIARLLLRSAQPMAAWHEREHQRAAAAVFPEGNRPGRAHRGRARSCGHGAQHQATEDARLANACRDV